MTVQIYRSTDSGAPVLNGTAGSLIAVLDHCLVSGLSWTKTVLGTNQAAYKQPSGSNGFSIQVDDTAGATAAITAYETITAFNTGTNEFHPTAGRIQLAKNPYSATPPIPWRLISNINLFHLIVDWYGSNTFTDLLTFGDIISYSSAADIYNTVLCGTPAYSSSLSWASQLSNSYVSAAAYASVARSYDQTSLSPAVSTPVHYEIAATGAGANGLPYPNCDGTLHLSPIWLAETAHSYRGLIPGIWAPCHQTPFQDGDQIVITTGPLSGRTFECAYGQDNQILIELSNTWGGF
jgi:hypothetical protein